MLESAITDFTNFLRNIEPTTRLIVIGICAIIALWSLISFINKNVEKTKVVWLQLSICILSIVCAILLAVFQ